MRSDHPVYTSRSICDSVGILHVYIDKLHSSVVVGYTRGSYDIDAEESIA